MPTLGTVKTFTNIFFNISIFRLQYNMKDRGMKMKKDESIKLRGLEKKMDLTALYFTTK